ncbi:hypothetical protein CN326_23115 [Bacillus sp. AFS018417]|nr:hypothetical protein CN326_23115 [Bacillus sp. AFS018417]
MLVLPHAHQANTLKCPQNENFIILQLFMRGQLIFFVLGVTCFLDFMDVGRNPYKQKGIVFQTSEPKRGINGRKTIRFRRSNGEMLQLVEERNV